MLKGFDPEAVFNTIEREKINFTLLVPTMIYVMPSGGSPNVELFFRR